MDSETIGALLSRVQAIESDIGALRRAIDGESLALSDRNYLSRCFDLLAIELDAVRECLRGMAGG